ncbi:MAG: carboxypeptidase M32 [Methylacidiphilales bacterium]|nr:carboxypeptidase M32 [Candidatus Methylacidiphilales bacterium]
MEAYQKLFERSRECALLNTTVALLHWDHQTHLPPAGAAYRGEQTAHLCSLSHRLFTAPKTGAWLSDCENSKGSLDKIRKANLREWRKRYDRAVKIPVKLVEELERATSAAHEAWGEARKAKDFGVFRPHLETIVRLRLQMAERWGYEDSPYDALLDEYEPGARSEELAGLFEILAPKVAALANRGVEKFLENPAILPPGPYPIGQQEKFNQLVAAKIGFDFQAGRIDTSAHPFCTGIGPGDHRLTTRYNESDFTSSLYGILHEAGHGLYEQGLPREHYGTPAGEAVSLGIHESQSRFWENHIGRSSAFWEYWFPVVTDFFPQLKGSSPEALTRYANRIEKSFIRVEADEVTYDLHIILRFEIEQRLIEGDLKAGEVPEYWNSRFEKLFGLKVPDDAAGCLQDIHWSGGSIGYFPTYTLGNLNAAQLSHTLKAEIKGLNAKLLRGEYGEILNWLRLKIHAHGSCLKPLELICQATGEAVDPEYHLKHLKEKVA